MTSDNLLKFLGNREYLHQVSYQELKSLVVQYPYSLSLRYLLGMKSRQEDNQDLDRNKELLATYGIDRPHLFDLFNEIPEVLEDLDSSILMQEDFLELKELSALERELDGRVLVPTTNDLTFIREELAAPIPSNRFTPKEESLIEKDIEIREPLDGLIPEVDDVTNEILPTLDEQIVLENQPEELSNEEFFEADYAERENIKDIPQEGVSAITSGESTTDHFNAIVENKGLPVDAIEINDFVPTTDEIQQKAIDDLFEETENEVIAEGAISDSTPYFENPEELLIQESKLVDINEYEEQAEASPIAKSDIPFEVIHSEIDPITTVVDTDLKIEADLSNEDEESIPKMNTEISSNELMEIKEDVIADSDSFVSEVEANTPSSEIIETITEKEIVSEIEEEEVSTNSDSFVSEVEANTPSSEIIETIVEKEIVSEIIVENEIADSNSFVAEVEANTPSSEIIETITETEIVPEIMEEPTAISEPFSPEVEANKASSEVIETITDINYKEEAINEIDSLSIENLAQVQEELHIEELDLANTPQITVEELSLIESTLHLKKDKKQPRIIARTKTPAPKIAFNSWATQGDETKAFSGINILKIPIPSNSSLSPNRRRKKKSKKRIKARFKKTVALAEESLKMSESIASETLAQLLVLQGHYKKATAMFKQLCLIMPEKSAFFAGEIEKIQNLKEEDS